MKEDSISGVSINFFIKDYSFQKMLLEKFGDPFIAEDVESIDCSSRNISSLDGIRIFINLKKLDCSNNQLQSIDVSSLRNLEFLNCQYNQIEELDLRALPNLKSVDCRGNNNIQVKEPMRENKKFLVLLKD